jgi:hypothetical protein
MEVREEEEEAVGEEDLKVEITMTLFGSCDAR